MTSSLLARFRDILASRMYGRALDAWHRYGRKLQTSHTGVAGVETDAEFVRTGLKCGQLAPDITAKLNRALAAARSRPFEKRAVRWSYFYPASSDEQKINTSNTFFDLGKQQLDIIESIAASIRPELTGAMGSGWRIVNVRYWATRPSDKPYGANAWHADGMPETILKLMIYPDGASETLGTTEVVDGAGSLRLIEGPAGAWMLFRNSVLQHRGLPAKSGTQRRIVELTIAPSKKTSTRPVAAGANAQYPFMPWLP